MSCAQKAHISKHLDVEAAEKTCYVLNMERGTTRPVYVQDSSPDNVLPITCQGDKNSSLYFLQGSQKILIPKSRYKTL